MRKLPLINVAIAALVGLALFAQPSPFGPIRYVTADPTGLACPATAIALRTPDGTLYTCQNGVYATTGGGGGAPSGPAGGNLSGTYPNPSVDFQDSPTFIYPCNSSNGSASAFTCTTGYSLSLVKGLTLKWTQGTACSGNLTLDVDGTGAKAIYAFDVTGSPAGVSCNTGGAILLTYNSIQDAWIASTPTDPCGGSSTLFLSGYVLGQAYCSAITVTGGGDNNLGAINRIFLVGNGALSAPVGNLSGTWIATGGTATTTKPYALIEPTGTTSTNWSTAGTGLGVNATSGFTGNIIDAQVNGVRYFSVASGGITFGATASVANVFSTASGLFGWAGRSIFNSPASGQFNITNNAATAGIGFDVATDGVFKVRTRAQSGYATADALGYSVSGVAGVTASGTTCTITAIVGGIITAASCTP